MNIKHLQLLIISTLCSLIFASDDGIVIELKEKTNQEFNEEMRKLETIEYKQHIKHFTLKGDDGTISELGALNVLEEFVYLTYVTISLQNNNIWDIRSLQDSIGQIRNLETLDINFEGNNILTYVSLNQALNSLQKLNNVKVSFNKKDCKNVSANYLKGEFIYFTRNACQIEKCDPTCQKCDHFNTKICTQCEGNTLLLVQEQTCISFRDCEQKEGFFPEEINSECVSCAENCLKCKDFQSCSICQPGNYRTENYKCNPCTVENCNLCSQDEQCDVCEDKHYLETKKSSKIFEDEDQEYGYNSENSNQNIFTSIYKLQKQNILNNSTDGESGDTCTPCSDDNCLSCSGKNKCSTCDSGFFLTQKSTPDNKKCFPCGDSNCHLCIDEQNCQECAESYFALEKQTDKLQCGACGEGCKYCTSEKICLECHNSKHYLYEGKCVKYCKDAEGQMISENKDGNKVCLDCTRNCQECIQRGNDIVCKRCNLFSYLHQEQCYENCPVGYASVPHWFSQKCKKCEDQCSDCSDYTNHCISCNNDEKEYYLVQDQNSAVSKDFATCETKVPEGYFVSDSKDKICNKCAEPCKECSNKSTQCTECQEIGFYLNEEKNSCLRCVELCDTCENGNSCKACQQYTYLENGKCVRNCSPGYKFNTKNKKCEKHGDATWVWVTAVILIVIGSGVGIFLYYRKKKREQLLEQDDMNERLDVQSQDD